MNHVEVFYTDKKNGWAVAFMDQGGNQIGAANFHYRKIDAELDAIRHGVPVHIYTMSGRLRKVMDFCDDR